MIPTVEARIDITQYIRLGMLIIIIGFVGLGGWAAFAPLSGAVIAPGTVKVDNNSKTIQHLEGGIVKEILVKDGDLVKQGQPLIIITDATVAATAQLLQAQLDAETAKEARLVAEKGYSTIQFPDNLQKRLKDPNVAKLLREEQQLFNARRDTLNDQIKLLNEQIVELKEEIARVGDQVKSEEQAIDFMQQDLHSNEALLDKKFIQRSHLLGMQRDLADHEALRSEHRADLSRAQQKMVDLQLKITTTRSAYMQQAADELEDTSKQIRDLQEKMLPSEDAIRRETISAPVAGKVVGLKVHTVGGVIGAKEPLMDIVPSGGVLMVEARIGVDDISEVHPGNDADIRITAYKQRSTPLLSGKVNYIAADRSTDEQSKTPYYIIRVKVDEASVKKAQNVELYPGMTAEVFVKTGARTAFEYLFEPITNTLRRSLRET
jgi:HlyD family type I secretion membrane fusion protein